MIFRKFDQLSMSNVHFYRIKIHPSYWFCRGNLKHITLSKRFHFYDDDVAVVAAVVVVVVVAVVFKCPNAQ